jgi:RES domain-containing protein
MPTVWRIVPQLRSATAFDGEGARRFGGRWNSHGTRMVYTSDSRALAALETLVHLTPQTLGRHLQLIGVELNIDMIEELPEKKLPRGWHAPVIPAANKQVGDDWIRSGRSLALKIPSAVIREENNFLLNPAHPDFPRLRIGPPTDFSFDPRVFVTP